MALDPKAQRLQALVAYRLLKAKAETVLGSALVNKQVLAVLANAAVLASKSSYQSLEIAIKASLLKAVTVTGKFFILLEPVDLVGTSESRLVQMSRLTRDDFRAIAQAFVSFSKPTSDSFNVSDVSLNSYGKNSNESITSSEQSLHAINKPLTEIKLSSDIALKGLDKSRSDIFSTQDSDTVLFGKNPSDSAITSDSLSRVVSYVRGFSDSNQATDGVSVIAVMDDGEVMLLNKSVMDYASTSDAKNINLAKALTDITVSSDLWIKAFNKPLADESVSTTYTQYSLNKPRDDSYSAIDRAILSLAKLVVDYIATADSQDRQFNKSINDFVSTSDALTFATALGKYEYLSAPDLAEFVRIAASGVPAQIENLHVNDVAAVLAKKFFNELLEVTDDFLHETNVDDDQTTSLIKNIPEVLQPTEQRSFSLQRRYSDSLGANSSGVLFWTNYSDSTYFSQSYVGNEQIFN